MQVSVETTEGLERKLTITVPAKIIEDGVRSRLQQLAKTQRINGFRPGKVPISVIQQRFGEAVRQEVAGDAMQQHYYQAIVQEKIVPAGAPTFELVGNNDSNSELKFAARFEVYPEVQLQGVEELEVEKPVVTITDQDLDDMMETLRKQHSEWKVVEQPAGAEDKVSIDFVGTIDGEEFEGGKAEDFSLELGQGRMIPGFEDPIVGLTAGEEVVADVTFPEDYQAEALKGKAAQFKITVKEVQTRELPELDDDFATKFAVTEGGLDALKAEVKKNMQRELDQAVRNKIKDNVLGALVEKNELELPSALVKQEVEVLKKQALERFSQGRNAANLPELPDDLFMENAERRVKIGLLLGEVIKQHEITADPARIDSMIETQASAYEDPSEVINYYKTNKELMQQMENLAVEEQAIDKILELAKVTDVEKPFSEMMNRPR